VTELFKEFPSVSRQKIERIISSSKRHGANRRAITRETGIDVALVLKVLKKAGIKTLHPHYHLDEERLRCLHESGSSDDEIAEQLGVPGPAVTTKRQRLGLPANKALRWPELSIGLRQEGGHLEIASSRDPHGRYEAICHCPVEDRPHPAGKRVYGGHFNAKSVKSCGRDSAALWAKSAYAKNRRSAAEMSRERKGGIMQGLSFQTCIVFRLCLLGLLGSFRMNDRAFLGGKEIDLVFPRIGEPKVFVEINESNHETAAARQRDTQKRDLAMYKFPNVEWVTISQRGFLENPDSEVGKIVSALQRSNLWPDQIEEALKLWH